MHFVAKYRDTFMALFTTM